MKLLAHDSRIVVVSSLVLIGYLEEKIRDMVIFFFFFNFYISLHFIIFKFWGVLLEEHPRDIPMRVQRADNGRRGLSDDETHRLGPAQEARRLRYAYSNILC